MLSKTEFVDLCGSLALGFGFPRSLGEIYGLLYLSPEPVSAKAMVQELGLSKASVSTGTRQLLALGFIRKVWKRDERRDYFEAEVDLWGLMSMAYERVVKIRAHEVKNRLKFVQDALESEEERFNPEDFQVVKERIDQLNRFRLRAKKFMPIIERLIK